MSEPIGLGRGRDPICLTELPDEEWSTSITVYHVGHNHQELPRRYVQSIDASQAGLLSIDGHIRVKSCDERLRDRIRELEAENDALARRNEDLHWQLEACRKAYNAKIDHILELSGLVKSMYAAFEREAPTVARRFREQVGRWEGVGE